MAKKLTTEEFIKKARLIHGDKYDYSLVVYINSKIKVKIICPLHGIFEQIPNSHLEGKGCQKCATIFTSTTISYDIESLIKRANYVHNFKYQYEIEKYYNNRQKISVICSIHGKFEQVVKDHLQGKGCIKCTNLEKLSTEEFIKKSKLIHGDKYNYHLVEYIRSKEKVHLDCVLHGSFWQSPNAHLRGSGCPKCNTEGKTSEPRLFDKIKETFIDENIISQGKPMWLGQQKFDIYFPEYNIAIEYQGQQHFKPNNFMGGQKKFINTKERDERKYKLCLENDCKLFYFTYTKRDVPLDWHHKVYTNEQELIDKIKKNINKNEQNR